jgi:predicted phosphodiesterase
MKNKISSKLPEFDRTFLPRADFEFVVVGDTHYILDPEPYAVEFDSVREWPDRADWALRLVAALKPAFVVHLGDLTEENPSKPRYLEARRNACEQIKRNGLEPYHVPGNMDIGDKPDATMWSDWVTPETLEAYHEQFGRSWYSFDQQGMHFVCLNSQIMNGPLKEADEQKQWLENDLSEHDGKRMFLFMHMPPFFVDEDEPDTGFYNSINEPARSWLTALLRKHQVELLFAGHTHFRAFNRVRHTRFLVAPSTTTSRAGFYEAFSVCPPVEQGRNDKDKLGFYLLRVHEDRTNIHFVRTRGETGPHESRLDWKRLLTRTSHALQGSPVGVYLRTPLVCKTEGAIAWPSVLRQRVRDDHPLLSCMELGAQHLRVPASDLDDSLQRNHLGLLRDEGIQVTTFWLWSDRLDLAASVKRHQDCFDSIELQVPGTLWPNETCLKSLAECGRSFQKPVTLTPVFVRERVSGKYHFRTRFGYRADELHELDSKLSEIGIGIERVLCHIDADADPWNGIQAFRSSPPLSNIKSFDFVAGLPGTDERHQAHRAAVAIFAAALQSDCRVYVDPFVDLDRTNDVNIGLLDRLSNPRPAFHVVRSLNTILFGNQEAFEPREVDHECPDRMLCIEGENKRHWLILPNGLAIHPESAGAIADGSDCTVVDLAQCTSQQVRSGKDLVNVLAKVPNPCLVTSVRP